MPFLTPSQRLHLEVYGFVLLPEVFSRSQVDALLQATYAIEAQFHKTGQIPGPACFSTSATREFFRIDNLPHLHPAYFAYLTNPYIVGLAAECADGSVRLKASDAQIHRPTSDRLPQNSKPKRFTFHRGINPAYAHTAKGLYHFSFIKVLTNLTDLGPGDGGTTLIPGTHKITTEVPQEEIIAAALSDPGLIYTVQTPAGSTLLFYESLIHSAGRLETDNERVFILGGYTPTMFQAWSGYDPDPDFVQGLSDEHRALLTGNAKYSWQRQNRRLGDPAILPKELPT